MAAYLHSEVVVPEGFGVIVVSWAAHCRATRPKSRCDQERERLGQDVQDKGDD